MQNSQKKKRKSEGKASLGLIFLTLNLEVFKKAKRRFMSLERLIGRICPEQLQNRLQNRVYRS